MTILAAAMIATLLLITPVLGYVPPGGGGSGSSSGSGTSSGSSEQTHSSTVSSGTFISVGDGWFNSEIKNNLPVSRISSESQTPPDQGNHRYTVAVMSEEQTNKLKKQVTGGSNTLVLTQSSEQTPFSYESLGRLAANGGFNAPQSGTNKENNRENIGWLSSSPGDGKTPQDTKTSGLKIQDTDTGEQLMDTKSDLNDMKDFLLSKAKSVMDNNDISSPNEGFGTLQADSEKARAEKALAATTR